MPNLRTAHALAERGMAASLDHAEREQATFGTVAFMFVHKYARTHRTFIAEDCIAAAVEWGLSVPVPKAFGSVFQRAARSGVITKVGFMPSRNRHGAASPLWRSNVYRDAQ